MYKIKGFPDLKRACALSADLRSAPPSASGTAAG